ncbi:sensor histidine kinase [Georgenia sp. Z1344]|uniref:sensor histidine kinase n=1 Tax=Georgenia sp. Z1344 TaxID=3416706 RepID=UPI003CF81613
MTEVGGTTGERRGALGSTGLPGTARPGTARPGGAHPGAARRRPGLWRSAVYLVLVVGDYVSNLLQPEHAPWQDVVALVLLPAVVVGVLHRVRAPLVLPAATLLLGALTGSSLVTLGVFALVLRRRDLVAGGFLLLAALTQLSPWGERVADVWVTGDGGGGAGGGVDGPGGWATALEVALSVAAAVVVPALLAAYLAARRRLAAEEAERARLAEDARVAREREAVLAERRRIAAEMHDAVGHQLALINLQAGALEVNPGAGPEVVERHAAAVRAAATAATRDLRAVLDVLGTDDAPAALGPQPGLADVDTLLDDAERAGATVRRDVAVEPGAEVPDATGRAAYRIVQESLTNALRHAPGAVVEVTVAADRADGVRVRVRNAMPRRSAGSATAGSTEDARRTGLGLRGLTERARSVGGTLSAGQEPGDGTGPVPGTGHDDAGYWIVRAHLPAEPSAAAPGTTPDTSPAPAAPTPTGPTRETP